MPSFQNWCQTTTCHGWANFSNAKTVKFKILWAILLVLLFIAIGFSLSKLISGYVNDHWTSRIYAETVQLIPPTVTICNYNRIQESKAQKFGFDKDLISLYFGILDGNKYFLKTDSENDEIVERYSAWRKFNNFTAVDVMDAMGQSCHDMIVKSWISGYDDDTKNGSSLCYSSDTEMWTIPVYTREYGRCVQIWQTRENEMLAGEKSGLSILLDAESEEYLTDVNNNYADEGFAIQISYNGSMEPGRWISISPGFHVKIAMQPIITRYSVLDNGMFTAPCDQHPKLPLLPSEFYSKETCINDCMIKTSYTDICGCNPGVPVEGFPVCEIEALFKCSSDQTLVQSRMMDFQERFDKCTQRYCKNPCYSADIKTTVSISSFPAKNQLGSVQKVVEESSGKHLNHGQIKNRLALVDVFYKTMVATIIEHSEKKSIEELISDIGGSVGLYLGISILTIIHAFTYCCYGFGKGTKKKMIDLGNNTAKIEKEQQEGKKIGFYNPQIENKWRVNNGTFKTDED